MPATQGCEELGRMMPKHFRNCPVLNKCREDGNEADDTDNEDDDSDGKCALYVKMIFDGLMRHGFTDSSHLTLFF